MSTFNLLDMAKSYFSNELLSKASSQLGESESGISKVISAAIPSLIGTIADKASSHDGAATVLKMATDQNDSGILDSLGGFFNSNSNSDLLSKGSGILGTLFGNGGQSNMLTTLISSFAGVKGSSVGTILSMAAPALLGIIGKHASENNVSASSLGSLLSSQKDAAMKMLPAGFSLSSLTGGASNAANAVTGAATSAYNNVEEKASSGMNWLLPLILLAGLAVASYYFFQEGCTKPDNTETTEANKAPTTTESAPNTNTAVEEPKITVDSLTGVVNYDLGAIGDLELPDGVKLTGVAANGFENTLVNFLKNGTIDTVNKKANWFNIHDVQFVSGKTEYATPKAMAQIKNIAAILKAYPTAVLKIGGYTDVTGDAAKNKALSQSRANQLMKDIVANGAAATQIKEAVGYGSEFAVAKAGDKEGMARDRRTAAKVSSK